LIVLLTLSVFPGIGEDEKMTVSPGWICTCRCVPLAILDNAAIGSPWLPVQRIITSLAGNRLSDCVSTNNSLGALMYPSSRPIVIALSILLPNTAILRP